MQIDLSGKIAVVTGSTGQLGRVMVRTLAACGADVAIHYNNSAAKALELKAEVQAMGRRAIAVKADITDQDQVLAMRDAIVEGLGWPDIVVDNAVIQYKWTNVLQQDAADFESQFRSCVMQNVFMSKAFVPHMVERRYGRFIGINTECAMLSLPGQAAYVTGKRGMDGLLKILAREVGEFGVTVNQIAPGWTISDNDRQPGAPSGEEYITTVPMKRRGTDQEIANVVAFLASDLSSFVTGAMIPVCGGKAVSPI
jgi:3-oxoacyl-[acyl-carrier protein] reductase